MNKTKIIGILMCLLFVSSNLSFIASALKNETEVNINQKEIQIVSDVNKTDLVTFTDQLESRDYMWPFGYLLIGKISDLEQHSEYIKFKPVNVYLIGFAREYYSDHSMGRLQFNVLNYAYPEYTQFFIMGAFKVIGILNENFACCWIR
jgi:hypothetical protein